MIIKKIAFYLTALVALVACGRPATITINFDGLDNPLVVFQYEWCDSTRIDSVMVENGSLHKEFSLKEPLCVLVLPHEYLVNTQHISNLNTYLKPGDRITYNAKCEDGYMIVDVEGSDLYKEVYSVLNRCAPAKAESFKYAYASWTHLENRDFDKYGEVVRLSAQKEDEAHSIIREYIEANPSSEASVILFDYVNTFRDKDKCYELIDKSLFKGPYKQTEVDYLNIKAQIEEALKKEEAESKARYAAEEAANVGKVAPDFTLKDTKGKSVSLNSLLGQWIVLDFWATWCGPCKSSMPKMKEYYEKYKGKFEIIGIAGSSKQEDWTSMVKDLGLPWINVISPKDTPEDKSVLTAYSISAFPTYVIINKEGKIHKTVIGAKQDLYDELDKILE